MYASALYRAAAHLSASRSAGHGLGGANHASRREGIPRVSSVRESLFIGDVACSQHAGSNPVKHVGASCAARYSIIEGMQVRWLT
jgi:hypothetical protein